MCGIYGWSFGRKPRLTPGQREVLASALSVANATRGRESWGYYARSGGKGVVHREVGNVASVAGLGSLGAWGTFMAHTRQSTTGKVTRDNCHPFQVGNILLAHNGIVFNHEELNKRHNRTCEVDSIHLAKHLLAGLPFREIEGYGAIEWIDVRKPLAVNLCRMASGSLSVAGIKSRGRKVGIVWSSDERHLADALEAAQLDWYMFEELKEGQVYQVNRGRYYILTSHRSLELSVPDFSSYKRRHAMYQTGWAAKNDWGSDAAHSVSVNSTEELTIYTADGTGFFKHPGRTEWYKDPDGVWRAHVRSLAGAMISVKCREGFRHTYDEVKILAAPVGKLLPATAGHTPVDRGLYADADGRIHDTEEDVCYSCGGSLNESGICPACDFMVSRSCGIHGLTEREWNELNSKE